MKTRCLFLLALVAVGCGGSRKFSVQRTLQADSSTTTASQTVLYDLSTVPEIAQDQGKVAVLHLDQVVADITSLGAANKATQITLSLALRPENGPTNGSRDLALGALGPIPLITGLDGSIGGAQEVDDFLLGVLKNNGGRFQLFLQGTADGALHFTTDVTLRGTVSP